MNTFEGPARLIHLAKPFYQEIRDAILAARFSARLCELSGLNQEQLAQVLEKTDENQARNQDTSPPEEANGPFCKL